jgi:predicted amidohydrolase
MDQMIVFSELCAFGPLSHAAQPFQIILKQKCKLKLKEYGIWLLPGSIFEKSEGNIYNTSVINPQRSSNALPKMFPFYPYETGVTQDYITACLTYQMLQDLECLWYDMWFPETIRTLVTMERLHPTLTGTIDREIELSIVRAMASINQCFM